MDSTVVDKYLNGVLENRDALLGLGGTWAFNVYLGKLLIFSLGKLTEKKARELFDLVDENNELNVKFYQSNLKIEITKNGNSMDENLLPNVFTRFFKTDQ